MTPADLDAAELALAEAARSYLTLSEPEWVARGSTSVRMDEKVTSAQVHAPIPINVSVVDWLVEADRVCAQVYDRDALGYPLVLGYGRRPDTDRVLAALAEDLADLPEELALAIADAGSQLVRGARRLLGLDIARKPVTLCPVCGGNSIILDPADDDVAVCSRRSCFMLGPEAMACACRQGGLDTPCSVVGGCGSLPGVKSRWSRAAGEWTVLGWIDATGEMVAASA